MHTTSHHRVPLRTPHSSGLFLVPRGAALPSDVRPNRRRGDDKAHWTTRDLVFASIAVPLLWLLHLALEHVFHV
jgi:hypothetical protein